MCYKKFKNLEALSAMVSAKYLSKSGRKVYFITIH